MTKSILYRILRLVYDFIKFEENPFSDDDKKEVVDASINKNK